MLRGLRPAPRLMGVVVEIVPGVLQQVCAVCRPYRRALVPIDACDHPGHGICECGEDVAGPGLRRCEQCQQEIVEIMARKTEVLMRDGWRCTRCGEVVELRGRGLRRAHVHHVRHRAHGGGDEIGNLVTLCRGCHQQEHATRGGAGDAGALRLDAAGDGR